MNNNTDPNKNPFIPSVIFPFLLAVLVLIEFDSSIHNGTDVKPKCESVTIVIWNYCGKRHTQKDPYGVEKA